MNVRIAPPSWSRRGIVAKSRMSTLVGLAERKVNVSSNVRVRNEGRRPEFRNEWKADKLAAIMSTLLLVPLTFYRLYKFTRMSSVKMPLLQEDMIFRESSHSTSAKFLADPCSLGLL